MSDHGRFAFEPLLNLVTGRPVGMEVVRQQARDQMTRVAANAVWGTRQLAEFDSGIAIASVLHGTGYDASVPLHVDVLADSVVAARRRVLQIRSSLQRRDTGLPTPPMLLGINPALSAAPPDALAAGLAELRAEGFGIGFDGVGRGFGLDLVAELEPDLVTIDAHLVARLPADPRARTVVTALCDVARAVGVRVCASGIGTADQLAAVRDHGIPWGQGPLLAAPQRRPSTAGVLLAPDLLPRAVRPPSPVPRAVRQPVRTALADLAQAAVSLPEQATAESVRQAFADHPQAGSVVLLDPHRRPTGFLDRNRFLLAISGPFGRALYANRPATSLAEPPRTHPAAADLHTAVTACLDGDRTRSYDDLVLVDGHGTCTGVVRVTDLLSEATGGTSAA
ncbi:EAL domain-containing protein [Pseudonocardia abyssalis]|uniref:EAL domain-containing protein n=1 Tax=Pseudonocardia abyssalis TaxID=2792008 RepID=A0ABS6UWZ2_9PSEU|nr:EAL domain-containing protein [Pseudonocardia abyssalis]MBW0118068.1 EAL domain-containing protein [Pseudonocardia abyssalis]MBW0136511.1 EAL domain-containing protein [Pseudonocardia abyssalis]